MILKKMVGACERNGVVLLISRQRNSAHRLKRKFTVSGLKPYCEKNELTIHRFVTPLAFGERRVAFIGLGSDRFFSDDGPGTTAKGPPESTPAINVPLERLYSGWRRLRIKQVNPYIFFKKLDRIFKRFK